MHNERTPPMRKRLLPILLALGLGLSAAAAAQAPDHLTVGIAAISSVIDFETNAMTRCLEQDGHLDLEFITFAPEAMIDRLNLMIQNGSPLPDVLVFGSGHRPQTMLVYNWALSGAIIPLTGYVSGSAPNFRTAMEECGGDLLPLITMPDGEIYFLPSYRFSIANEYQHKNWIYQPWLNALGLPAPTDAESLYAVLRAFREQDPNGNGLADEIPLLTSAEMAPYTIRSLLSMFCNVGSMNEGIAVADGRLVASYTTEAYREGLRYIRRLVQEGLFSALSFTMDEAQFANLLSQETTVVGMSVRPSLATSLPFDDPRRAEYAGIAPLAMADGSVLTPYTPTVANAQFVITSSCANPDAAFRLGDLLCSEKFTIMNRWGVEGVDWVRPPEGAESLYSFLGYDPLIMTTGHTTWGAPQNQYWASQGPFIRGYRLQCGQAWNGDPLDSEYMIARIMPAYIGRGPKEYIGTLNYTMEENEQLCEPLATINSYVSQTQLQFITGVLSLERDWDEYLRQLDASGLDTVLDIMQTAYDRSMQQK